MSLKKHLDSEDNDMQQVLCKPPRYLRVVPSPESANDCNSKVVYIDSPSKTAANFSPNADRTLALDWLLTPKSAEVCLSERVLARLIQIEAQESDVSLRDDIRQAFIAVNLAAKGNPIPFIHASYSMYGLHPDKVWPAILAKRKALLGPEITQLRKISPNFPKSEKERKRA